MKKSRKNLFDEIKVKMVMKVYGISRGEAMKRVAKRRAETARYGNGGKEDSFAVKVGSIAPDEEEEMMSAEEFFGG